jgi:hypothetical protein
MRENNIFFRKRPVPEFIDPVFTKTSPIRSFSVIQNERFGLVFAKTGSIISGTGFSSITSNSAPTWLIAEVNIRSDTEKKVGKGKEETKRFRINRFVALFQHRNFTIS